MDVEQGTSELDNLLKGFRTQVPTAVSDTIERLSDQELEYVGSRVDPGLLRKLLGLAPDFDAIETLLPYLRMSLVNDVVTYALSSPSLGIDPAMVTLLMLANQYLPKNSRGYISYFSETDYEDPKKIRNILLTALVNNNVGFATLMPLAEYDPKALLQQGIVPSNILNENDNMYLKTIKDGMSDEVYEFWYGRKRELSRDHHGTWRMVTTRYALREELSTFELAFMYPDLLYKSGRLRTDMSMFRTPFSQVGDINTVLKYVPTLTSGEYEVQNVTVPVIRYSAGLDVGLYHRTRPDTPMCGTFFYYEPESTTYLKGERVLVAETKCRACQYLYNIGRNEDLNNIITVYLLDGIDEAWNNNRYRDGLMYTPWQAVSELGFRSKTRTNPRIIEQFPVYMDGVGGALELYAREDIFDQPLCNEATKLGYDLVILTRMVGKYQIVTEVLDTRPRDVCISNLIYT